MQITIDFGYDQVFELARQLSPEEREKLVHDLRETDSEPGNVEKNREKARRLALECPVATEEEIEMQNEFRRMFRCRPS